MSAISKSLILLNLCLTMVFHLDAQTNFHPPITNYSPKDYGKLRTPENWDICQDNRGVVYSAGGNGILEFDGSNWSFVDVKHGTYTVSLDSDNDGNVFVGSVNDFGYLKPNKIGDLKFISLVPEVPEKYLDFSIVWNTMCTDHGVYFQSEEYIFRYFENKITVYEPQTAFHTSFEVNGHIYVREKHVGLAKLDGDSFKPLKNTDTLAEAGVFGLIGYGNDLLIITREKGMWLYTEKTGHLDKIESPDEDELNHAAIQGSIKLSNGNIAVNTIESGVLILSDKGRILHRINKRTGIRVNDVKSVFEDRENNLWLALNNGISKVNYNSPLSYYTEETNLEGSVQDIIRFKDHLFAGTSSGLFIQNPDKDDSKEFIKHEGISSQVWDFYPIGDKLLIGTGEGLYEMTVKGDQYDLSLKSKHNTNAIVKSSETGDIITAGADGFLILTSTYEELQFIEQAISGITGIVSNPNPQFADEEIWIGTIQLGVLRIQIHNKTYSFNAYAGFEDGLPDGQWARPFIHNNQVLFGTTEGIFSFQDEHELVEEGVDPDDLPGNVGMFMPGKIGGKYIHEPVSYLIDTKDRTWICVNEQIMYYDKSNDYKLVNRPFWGINFGRVNRFYIDDEGVLWIGTADGLIRYEENESKDYAIPFYSIIRRITLSKNDTIYNGGFSDITISGVENEIVYAKNSIQFNFAAPYFEDDHKVVFSYILEGQDEEWSDWVSSTKAAYTTLREGNYTFRVKAKNIYGQESEVASFRFTILPPWYRSTWAYVAYVALGLIIIFLAIRLSLMRLKKKNERLEELIAERTAEIASQNQVLQTQKDEIEHQQEEIMDSINYAKRIQEAILPIEEEMKQSFPESFVLYIPKDVVSGDFYWYAQVEDQQIVVCADCTGHGVPGAFMSMIGTDKLNHFVKERKYVDPSLILSEMNKGIKKSLKQSNEESTTRDGMDAAICTFDLTASKVLYSGANRSLWIIRNGELIETKATKAAVAGHTDDNQRYELHELEIRKGDLLYMSTDGYADQFGGSLGKKLKVKAMKQILLDNTHLNLKEQGKLMEQHLLEWMGDFEQVDDVCVIGIRI